jgi:hypothetical protein
LSKQRSETHHAPRSALTNAGSLRKATARQICWLQRPADTRPETRFDGVGFRHHPSLDDILCTEVWKSVVGPLAIGKAVAAVKADKAKAFDIKSGFRSI